MTAHRSPIPPTDHPALERELHALLQRRAGAAGDLGELKAIALRLGLVQGTARPRFHAPQLVIFAADHGLAAEGVVERLDGAATVARLLAGRLPLAAFARLQDVALTVVDCGIAEAVAPHPRLLPRKIAHGSRSARMGTAMSPAQAQAGMRAGMELADALPGNVLMCAGLGAGGLECGALVIARLTGTDVETLVERGPAALDPQAQARRMMVLHTALERHRALRHPVEVLAAFGGHDMTTMVGAMLVAASRRHLLVLDGMAACAAFLVASRLAPEIRPYGLFCHSRDHRGLQRAQQLLDGSPMLEMGLDTTDGTGALLAWPLLRHAAALLSEVAEGDEPP